jgi:D-lactate dehydrogenase
MRLITGSFKKIIPAMPLWSNQLKPTPRLSRFYGAKQNSPSEQAVVYFPACISQVMGGAADKTKSVIETFMSVSAKAGINFIIPPDIAGTCCGQPFSSKGFNQAYAYMANKTINKLWKWTNEGRLPVVMDITACTHTLHSSRSVLTTENQNRFDSLRIMDSIVYIADYILPNATVLKKKSSVVLHPVCSLYKMGLEAKFIHIARWFADAVEVPAHAGCCGMAGDRGFLFPEFTQSATKPEADDIKGKEFEGYYSTSKTCEIAMSDAVGKNYHSILHLVDECI